MRLHYRGQRRPRHARLRLLAAQRAVVRRCFGRPGPLRHAPHPRRAREPPVRAELVADRPGRRLRGELRQPPRRPARALADGLGWESWWARRFLDGLQVVGYGFGTFQFGALTSSGKVWEEETWQIGP